MNSAIKTGGEAHRPVGGGGETVGQQADQAAGQVGYRGVQALSLIHI